MKLDIKGYPIILKLICVIVLLPILAAPLVFYLSVFVFDDPGANIFAQFGIFFGVNSYSLILLGICLLSVYLYTRYRSYLYSLAPFVLLLFFIWGAIWYYNHGPIDKENVRPSDYRLFRDTPCEALAKAVDRQDTELIEQILQSNPALANYKEEKYDQCVLFQAVKNGKLKSAEALLKNGADPNIVAAERRCNPQHPTTAICYVSESYGATDDECLEVIRLLVEYGADVDSRNCNYNGTKWNQGITALNYNAEYGRLKTVRFLLENGADPNIRGNDGVVPLEGALIQHHYDVAMELLKHGANPDLRDPSDDSTVRDILQAAVNGTSYAHNSEEQKMECRKLLDYINNTDTISYTH